ncbi:MULTISPECIES: GNAT family N-acetyltransferase [unclassified Streptomyces]|uniref:GNAT family N-acetyltransferase n=1 Tax=unclassified Streptomyces TaxID=2593676 RepID=UPI002E29D7F5|nr:GNAT family N-acetyltransferase [Streptomyces sp. NBC_00441]
MEITYGLFEPSHADELAAFLSGSTWPFHGRDVVEPDEARRWVDEGRFGGDDNRSFWITRSGERVGFVRLMDLCDNAPLFDLRIRSEHRGRGLGGQAVAWLTRYAFTEFPQVRRIEGNTRQDNAVMRRTFQKCGYVKEAHYRDAWPAADGTVHDAVGYAILRRDWVSGTTTVPDWSDERVAPSLASRATPT